MMTQRLLLRLTEATPQLLLGRFGIGPKEASTALSKTQARHGCLVREKWRFAAVCEAYVEHFGTQRARENFIDILIAEFVSFAIPERSEETASMRTLLFHTELLVGIIVNLPYR